MVERLEVENELVKYKGAINQNIVLFLLGKLVSLFGSSIYSFAIGLYVLNVTGSGKSFALTIVFATLPRAIVGPISGVLADRLDKKKLVVLLDIISGLIVLGLLGASIIDELRISYIYTAILLLNVTNVFFDTTISAAIPQLVSTEKLTQINSFSGAISNFAFILGPFLGGLIIGIIDIKVFLLINGLSFIFSGITEMFLDFKIHEKMTGVKKEQEMTKINFVKDIVEGFKYMKSTKWILSLALSAAMINMIMTLGLNIPLPVIMRNQWLFSDVQYGIVMASFPLGMIFASIVVGIIPQGEKNHKRIVLGMVIFTIVMILFGTMARLLPESINNWTKSGMLIVMFMVMAAGSAILNIPIMVTIQKNTEEDKLGRVMGVLTTIATVMIPLGAVIGSFLIDKVSPWMIPSGCGIMMILLTIYIAQHKHLRKA